MKARKFKKGQHVILHRAKNGKTLGIPVECFGGEAIVDEATGSFSYHINMIDRHNGLFGWSASEDMLEAVHTQVAKKIVVTTDGKETLARVYEDGKVVKKTTARCSDDDEFDFETGARIALSRLIPGEEKPEEPKYYTGRFVAIRKRTDKIPMPDITIGKIYKCENGRFADDDGCLLPFGGAETLDYISMCIGYNLLEVKEEQSHAKKIANNLLTGRVICTKSGEPKNFTIGKVYNVVNGEYTNDRGDHYRNLVLEDVDEQDMCTMHFVKIKE